MLAACTLPAVSVKPAGDVAGRSRAHRARRHPLVLHDVDAEVVGVVLLVDPPPSALEKDSERAVPSVLPGSVTVSTWTE